MNRHTIIAGLLLLSLTAGRVTAEGTNSTATADLSSFKIISDRNIFNPNRSARNPRSENARPQKVNKVDTFALLGTLSYEKGRFAFFDGSSSSYKKTLKTTDTIAGYQVTEITANSVKLAATNQPVINLLVGMQMKREEEGPWAVTERTESYSSSAPAAASESPKASGSSSEGMSDIMKRLMQKREQESK